MAEGLRSLGDALAPWLLTYLLHSTLLIAAAWTLARTGVARRARTLDLLWKTALLAGLVTTGWSQLGPGGRTESGSTTIRATVREGAPAGALVWRAQDASTTTTMRLVLTEPSGACMRLLEAGPSIGTQWRDAIAGACAPRAAGSWAGSWAGALAALWTLGAAVGLALRVRSARALALVLRRATRPGPAVARGLERLRGRFRAHAQVVVSDAVASPCALGGRIVLPPRCEVELAAAELEAALAHELAHLERRDPFWLMLSDVLCRLAWMQPLNRVAAAGLVDAAETACDERAVRHARPLDLARSIHRVAEWAVPGVEVPHGSALARGDGRALSRRVRRILASETDARGGSGLGGVALAGLLLAGGLALPPVPVTREVRAVFMERVQTLGVPEATAGERREVHVFVRRAAATDARIEIRPR